MKFPRAMRPLSIAYLILHIIMALLFTFVLTRIVRNQMLFDARQKMDAMTVVLSEHISELDGGLADPSLPEHLSRLFEKTGMRFTLITDAGDVLADSITGTKDIGQHGTREEVLLARQSSIGFSQRYSATLNKPMMYLAHAYPGGAVTDQTGVTTALAPKPLEGFVRVAVPSISISQAIGSIQTYLWLFALSLGVLTAFLMAVFSARIMQPLNSFATAAKQVGVGRYAVVTGVGRRNDEWGDLREAFEQMQSELTRREEHLLENTQRLEAVLSSMIEGVLALEPSGEVMLANGAACRMLSLTHSGLVGRKLLEIVRIPELTVAIGQTQLNRKFSQTEFKTRSDPPRTLSARVSLLANKNKTGVAVVLHDVTELRQLETMRRDFVANVSHELKTPLSSIKAYAETLRLGALHDSEKNLQFVEQIEFQAEMLNRQIQDLLHLARVESGETAFQISTVGLNAVCEKCFHQFKDQAIDRGLTLKLDLVEVSPEVKADVDAMETAVRNLVINAIHYTPEGGSVTIATRVDGRWVELLVSDTGIGIAQDQQTRVFERFYRVDKARSRDAGGTGLGLAIVKHLTQAFGGSVKLESQLGKGSTFHIRLPLV